MWQLSACLAAMLLFLPLGSFMDAFVVTVPSTKMSTTLHAARESSSSTTNQKNKIPIHLLAGFLGSGKTTTLKHVLENKENLKLGVLVNDVAAINIDAKLIAAQSETMVELQNGCACCSLADELLESLNQLLLTQKAKNNELDAVIVELSGVSDPVAIANNWKAAVQQDLLPSVTDNAELGNVVTVLDACTFGQDYMTFDVLKDRKEWFSKEELDSECGSHRKVVELLAEQTEAADIIVVNKADLAGDEQVEITRSMAASLNDKASLVTTSWGKVQASQLLVQRPNVLEVVADDNSCNDPDCTDDSHSHSHSHDHAAGEDCTDPGCTDASHSHSHSHDHATADCSDPDCTDTSHSHSHSHATATDSLGITNFVYKAQRPFDAARLMALLYRWPVPIKDELDLSLLKDSVESGYSVAGKTDEKSPFVGVLRSKGFCWFAPTAWEGPLQDAWRHQTAMYWSNAGKHLGIQEAGRWWASVDEERMREFFVTNPAECDRILSQDFVSEEFGDRRQEIVFIGVDLDQTAIQTALDECLLTDEEMETYRAEVKKLEETIAVEVQ